VTGDDDVAASLPRPPIPAPARRAAAISEALRRFDGGEARPARTGEDRRPALWARPYAGALAGAFLVALIGLPFVWTSFDNYADDRVRPRPETAASGPVKADVDADGDADRVRAGPAAPRKAPPAAAEEVEPSGPDRPAPAEPEPPLEPEPEPAPRSEEPAAGVQDSGGDVVVTGSRISRPNLESSVPVTVVGGNEVSLRSRRAAKAARRGDWNACTIEDPGRSLERCRSSASTVARGATGPAGAQLKDGLASAWEGDLEGAMAAFDRAIELSPRSSAAWLNRGLAWRRRGDLDRALADLDKAVLYAPNDARAYYHRGLVLRQRGDLRRARADEERAVRLDPRYAPLVGSR
jgi:hypothetical protein